MGKLNDEQKSMISHLICSDIECIKSVLDHEEYSDDNEKVELEEQLALLRSIPDTMYG